MGNVPGPNRDGRVDQLAIVEIQTRAYAGYNGQMNEQEMRESLVQTREEVSS